MATRIDNRGFHFGMKTRDEALSIAKAHPWAVFELTIDNQCIVSDQRSAISCIEEIDGQIKLTLY